MRRSPEREATGQVEGHATVSLVVGEIIELGNNATTPLAMNPAPDVDDELTLLREELPSTADSARHGRKSHAACAKALNCPHLPAADKARILRNDAFALEKLASTIRPASYGP